MLWTRKRRWECLPENVAETASHTKKMRIMMLIISSLNLRLWLHRSFLYTVVSLVVESQEKDSQELFSSLPTASPVHSSCPDESLSVCVPLVFFLPSHHHLQSWERGTFKTKRPLFFLSVHAFIFSRCKKRKESLSSSKVLFVVFIIFSFPYHLWQESFCSQGEWRCKEKTRRRHSQRVFLILTVIQGEVDTMSQDMF